MAVPKRHKSHSRTRTRRSHDALVARHLITCPKCSRPVPAHAICPNCGNYMGRKVLDVGA